MAGERQRMRPWLECQIDSGLVPQLSWVDRSQGIFRVPWKHAGKPGFDLEKDAVLFREWARHTGKYRDGEQPDPSTWKTRFRCAINKLPDIEEVKDRSDLDGEEPYRVYKFLPKGVVKSERIDIIPHVDPSPPTTGIRHEEVTHSLHAGSFLKVDECLDDDENEDLDKMQETLMDIYATYPDADDPCFHMSPENSDNSYLMQTYAPMVYERPQQSPVMNPLVDINTINEIIGVGPEALPMELEVKIYYRGKQVAENRVINRHGCRIHSGVDMTWLGDMPQLYGPRDVEQIQFPEEVSLLALMENLNRGLLLQFDNNSIVATRFCQAHVYASGGCFGSEVQRLDRGRQTKVFDNEGFLEGLAEYRVNRAPVPLYEVFFAFGQKPASGTTVDPGVYITVSVTHVKAKASISVIGSASDVNLSREDDCDRLIKGFKQMLNLQPQVPQQAQGALCP